MTPLQAIVLAPIGLFFAAALALVLVIVGIAQLIAALGSGK